MSIVDEGWSKEEGFRRMMTKIRTRCPACGQETLIVASGGSLVCSWTKCKQPGAINDARAVFSDIREFMYAKQDTFEIHDPGDMTGYELRQARLTAAEARLIADAQGKFSE